MENVSRRFSSGQNAVAWPLPKWNACSSEATIRAFWPGRATRRSTTTSKPPRGFLSSESSRTICPPMSTRWKPARSRPPRTSLHGNRSGDAHGEQDEEARSLRESSKHRFGVVAFDHAPAAAAFEVAPPWRTEASSGRGARVMVATVEREVTTRRRWSIEIAGRMPRMASRRAACSCDRETGGRRPRTSRRSAAGLRRRARRTPGSTCLNRTRR